MHQLMYRDIPVMEFDKEKEYGKVLHPNFLPFIIKNETDPWDMIRI